MEDIITKFIEALTAEANKPKPSWKGSGAYWYAKDKAFEVVVDMHGEISIRGGKRKIDALVNAIEKAHLK